MCSLGDNDGDKTGATEEKYMQPKPKLPLQLETQCIKCRGPHSCIVLRGKDSYCRTCFLTGTVHKFKALLGKHRPIHVSDRILVHHRAGHAGTALLRFIRDGMDLMTPKKLRFKAAIMLFVEDQIHLSLTKRKALLMQIEAEARLFQFPVYFVSFVEYILWQQQDTGGLVVAADLFVDSGSKLNLADDDGKRLGVVLAKQKNETNRNDLMDRLRRRLLTDAAKHLECQLVFTGELSEDIASKLLTNISLGRGVHVPIDTGFCDARDSAVKIVRPLRLFDIKELAYFNYFSGLEPCSVMPPSTHNPFASVQNLMRKFVSDLQLDYPATVTTLLKTGDKLAMMNSMSSDVRACELCQGPLIESDQEQGMFVGLTSAESTQFSHWVSTQTPDHSKSSQRRYDDMLASFQNCFASDYCFSCQKLMK